MRRAAAEAVERPLIDRDRPTPMSGTGARRHGSAARSTALSTRFDFSAPLELDHEDQYRRSEEPYAGPEEFSATAAVGWDHGVVYVAVEVRKPELVVRGRRRAAAPARQRARRHPRRRHPGLRPAGRRSAGATVSWSCPRATTAASASAARAGPRAIAKVVQGAWQATENGYSDRRRDRATGVGASAGRRDRVRSAGQPDRAGARAALGATGLERRRWLGLPPRRPAGPVDGSACWSCAEWIASPGSPRPAASAPARSSARRRVAPASDDALVRLLGVGRGRPGVRRLHHGSRLGGARLRASRGRPRRDRGGAAGRGRAAAAGARGGAGRRALPR